MLPPFLTEEAGLLPTLHIKLLGDFSLVSGDQPLTSVNTARLQSLMAYLVLHRDAPQSRQHLAFLLWPDSTEAQARTNLRREFHHLRHGIPDANRFLRADAKMMQWRRDAPCTLDVATFEDALAAADRAEMAGDSHAMRERLEAAVAVYKGDLLPGCYDEWLLPERERLKQEYARALERLAGLLEDQREYAAAIRYAQRLLRHDPLHEASYCRLMRLYALNNDRASALRVYHTCVTTLQRELAIEPDPATRAVYERLLSSDASSPPGTAPRPPHNAGFPLIGRQREWEALQAAWHTATGRQAHFVCIAGEAGIGKTRLAEELLHWAGQQGIATAKTRCYAAEGGLAYAPVAEWLRSNVIGASRAQLAPIWLTEVARLLPELLVEWPDLSPPEPLAESWQRLRLFEALARATLTVRQPLLLLIDDLQWCDQETLAWLRYLLHFDPAARLLILSTARVEEVAAEHPFHALLSDLRGAEQLTEVVLGPLDATETAALAAQVAGRELEAGMATRLYQDTEGHPLFVVETLRSVNWGWERGVGEHPATPNPQRLTAIPRKVHALLSARLAQLSEEARELASLAATIGRAFTVDVLAEASTAGEDALMRGLDELWRRNIVREQGADAYDFSHDKIREVAYAAVSAAHRRLLHRRVAQALEHVYAADLDAVSGQVAAHYERAGLPAQAIPYYQRAAAVAQRVYANQEAIDLLTRGLALLARLPDDRARDEQELALQTTLGVSLVALKGYTSSEVKAAYERARALCVRLGRPQSAPALRALAIGAVVGGELQHAYDLGQQLLHLAQDTHDPMHLVEGHYVLGVTCFWQGAFVSARMHLEQAIAHYDPQQHRAHVALYAQDPKVICLIRLAYTLWFLGYPDQALRCSEEGLALAQELAHPFSLGYALYFAACLANDLPDSQTARERVAATLRIATEQRLTQWIMMGSVLQGWALVDQDEVAPGIAQIRQGIAVYRENGAYVDWPYYLALLARAYTRLGAIEQGLAALAESLAVVDGGEVRWYAAELHRLKGELLLAQGAAADEVEGCFRLALEIARRQEAKTPELRAAMSLSRLWQRQGKASAARDLLAGIYRWFTEGFDTPDLQEARALLDRL